MKQVSVRQLELLVDFMERHTMLALGRVRGKEGHLMSNKLWTELAAILNCETVDATLYRSPKEWNKFYNDYKCRLKNKSRRYSQSQRKTGGGPADAPPLTDLEQRLCSILGDKFEGLPVRQIPVLTEAEETILIDTNIGESPSLEILDILESETPIRIVEENTLLLDENQPSTSSALPADNIKTKQPSFLKKYKNNERSTPRKERVTEVEKTKQLLADIEMARLKTEQAKIQAHLDRNEIEKDKVKAINNLASAGWAYVNFLKSNMEGNKRNCDGCGSDRPKKRPRSRSSD